MSRGKELEWLYPKLPENSGIQIKQEQLDELIANQRAWVDWLEKNPDAKIHFRNITNSKPLFVEPIQNMGALLPDGYVLLIPAEGAIHFDSCVFDDSTFQFHHSEFTNKILFSEVSFKNSSVTFYKSKLIGRSFSDFRHVSSDVTLEFSSCYAEDTLFEFSKSTIENDFIFKGKYKNCEFRLADINLNGMAKFNCTFRNTALYLDSAVVNKFRFYCDVFDSNLSFIQAEFKEYIFFEPDQYVGNNLLSFKGATFHKTSHFGEFQSCNPIDFRNTDFGRAPVFGNLLLGFKKESVKYGVFQRARDIYDTSKFLRLKKLAKDADNLALALDCYANEMRSSYWHTLTGYKLAFYYLYDWSSNYGRSVSRPFMGLFMFWGLFCSAYWFSRTNLEASPWSSLVMSLGHSIPLYSGAKEARSAGMDDLYLSGIDIPHYVHALTIGQGIISGIFIFLIALALRNMFRS